MDALPILSVRDLRVTFKSASGLNEVLHGISYQLYANEILGIVGESGSGKSVASLAVMGLLPLKSGVTISGEIIFNSDNVIDYSQKQLETIRGR